jgi:hypothetical protein
LASSWCPWVAAGTISQDRPVLAPHLPGVVDRIARYPQEGLPLGAILVGARGTDLDELGAVEDEGVEIVVVGRTPSSSDRWIAPKPSCQPYPTQESDRGELA